MNLPKVFMIGWEFPPFNSGGLGTACQGLTEALAHQSVQQVLALPKQLPIQSPYLEVTYPGHPLITQLHINMEIHPYGWFGSSLGLSSLVQRRATHHSASSMVNDAEAYADVIEELAEVYPHDIIHAHDWFTYPAALRARKVTRKPLVLHVHSTEFDRTLNGNSDPAITAIESQGLHQADRVITVSEFTRQMVLNKYQVPADKVVVVHNGIDLRHHQQFQIADSELQAFANGRKLIIFVGRITCQKGPDYFIEIAQRISQAVPESLFVLAGMGDMYEQIMLQAAAHQLTGKLLFAGFLRDRQRELLYRRANLFIMPSVSEPFGIVALEAAANHTPVIISYQSGVAEVMQSAMKANFWDVEQIANQAIQVLQSSELAKHLAYQGAEEVQAITWEKAARKCVEVYQRLMQN